MTDRQSRPVAESSRAKLEDGVDDGLVDLVGTGSWAVGSGL